MFAPPGLNTKVSTALVDPAMLKSLKHQNDTIGVHRKLPRTGKKDDNRRVAAKTRSTGPQRISQLPH